MDAALEADTPLPRRHRRATSEVLPGGRRVLMLEQVAGALQVDVRTVRKLIRIQRDEDAAAVAESRPTRAVGLRAVYISDRVTRVTEQALGDYLQRGTYNKPR